MRGFNRKVYLPGNGVPVFVLLLVCLLGGCGGKKVSLDTIHRKNRESGRVNFSALRACLPLETLAVCDYGTWKNSSYGDKCRLMPYVTFVNPETGDYTHLKLIFSSLGEQVNEKPREAVHEGKKITYFEHSKSDRMLIKATMPLMEGVRLTIIMVARSFDPATMDTVRTEMTIEKAFELLFAFLRQDPGNACIEALPGYNREDEGPCFTMNLGKVKIEHFSSAEKAERSYLEQYMQDRSKPAFMEWDRLGTPGHLCKQFGYTRSHTQLFGSYIIYAPEGENLETYINALK